MKQQSNSAMMKIAKVLGVIVAVAFLLICIAQLWALVWGGAMLKSKMQERINSGSDGLYHFEADKVNLSLFGRSVTFRDATITHDQEKYNKLKSAEEADKRIYEMNLASLRVSGINIIKLIRNNEFRISGLSIKLPVIKIYNNPEISPEKEDDKAKFTLYSLFSPGLNLVEIDKIEISGGSIEMITTGKDSTTTMHIYNLNTGFHEILIDSTHGASGEKLFSAEKMDFSTDSIFTTLDNGIYHLTAHNLVSSSDKNFFSITNIVLEPQVAKFDFAHQYGYENDRIDLLIDDILIENASLVDMIQSETIKAGKITINKFNMHVFRDKRLKLADVYKKLPQEMLRDLSVPVQIDTLEMVGARISYEEFPDTGDEAGNIFFSNIDATVYNINNKQEDNAEIKINAIGYIYGTSRLDANFNIPVYSENNLFYFSGSLEQTNATIFNEMSIPIGGVRIESAIIQKMEFKAQANTTHSQGTMKLYYDNLEVKIRDQETGKRKGLQSFLANLLVVKNSNPKNGEFREGEMKFERDTRKAITNYCWKTILSGMKSSIGMSAELTNEDE
ncbi:MAG: hypothetical protein ACR2GN_03390 [Bacteroidia bacterium]